LFQPGNVVRGIRTLLAVDGYNDSVQRDKQFCTGNGVSKHRSGSGKSAKLFRTIRIESRANIRLQPFPVTGGKDNSPDMVIAAWHIALTNVPQIYKIVFLVARGGMKPVHYEGYWGRV
jgi:hypothetical protein